MKRQATRLSSACAMDGSPSAGSLASMCQGSLFRRQTHAPTSSPLSGPEPKNRRPEKPRLSTGELGFQQELGTTSLAHTKGEKPCPQRTMFLQHRGDSMPRSTGWRREMPKRWQASGPQTGTPPHNTRLVDATEATMRSSRDQRLSPSGWRLETDVPSHRHVAGDAGDPRTAWRRFAGPKSTKCNISRFACRVPVLTLDDSSGSAKDIKRSLAASA